MQEAMYPALASSLALMQETGEAPKGTGNHHGGLAVCPYSVYPASDGWIAIACVLNDHWIRLTEAMEATQLADDERYRTVALRCQRMQEVDDLVAAWTVGKTKQRLVDRLSPLKVPVSAVRDLKEVMHDPHMHGRGMLEWIDDPDLGRIVVPSTPLRIHETSLPATLRRPDLGENTDQILRDHLGMSTQAIRDLRQAGAI